MDYLGLHTFRWAWAHRHDPTVRPWVRDFIVDFRLQRRRSR